MAGDRAAAGRDQLPALADPHAFRHRRLAGVPRRSAGGPPGEMEAVAHLRGELRVLPVAGGDGGRGAAVRAVHGTPDLEFPRAAAAVDRLVPADGGALDR